jgi:hypothetical protein
MAEDRSRGSGNFLNCHVEQRQVGTSGAYQRAIRRCDLVECSKVPPQHDTAQIITTIFPEYLMAGAVMLSSDSVVCRETRKGCVADLSTSAN